MGNSRLRRDGPGSTQQREMRKKFFFSLCNSPTWNLSIMSATSFFPLYLAHSAAVYKRDQIKNTQSFIANIIFKYFKVKYFILGPIR
jgi:hypothetical protein